MTSTTNQIEEFNAALLANARDYDIHLSNDALEKLTAYYQLILTWNPRLHLVAPCLATEFAQRHILESLLLLQHLPAAARIIDIGSGAGLPVIPCLIVRADLKATLMESAKRKAVFLREALRTIGRADSVSVVAERFEAVTAPAAQFITCRALDRFGAMLPHLIEWAPRPSNLLLFGGEQLQRVLDALKLTHARHHVPKSERRFLFVVELERK